MKKKTVWRVQHAYSRDGIEECKDIGIFSTRAKALATVRRLKKQTGFKRYINGFHVDCVTLDFTAWEGGFSTIRSKAKRSNQKG